MKNPKREQRKKAIYRDLYYLAEVIDAAKDACEKAVEQREALKAFTVNVSGFSKYSDELLQQLNEWNKHEGMGVATLKALLAEYNSIKAALEKELDTLAGGSTGMVGVR